MNPIQILRFQSGRQLDRTGDVVERHVRDSEAFYIAALRVSTGQAEQDMMARMQSFWDRGQVSSFKVSVEESEELDCYCLDWRYKIGPSLESRFIRRVIGREVVKLYSGSSTSFTS